MGAFLYEFEWDSVKAKANFSKHEVDFERATQIFRDPLAITITDEEHSDSEVRWQGMSGFCASSFEYRGSIGSAGLSTSQRLVCAQAQTAIPPAIESAGFLAEISMIWHASG